MGGLLHINFEKKKANGRVQGRGVMFVCNAQGHPVSMVRLLVDLISLATNSTNRLLSGTIIVVTDTDITQFW